MSNKKRLYEIFSKVNKLPLNEQDDLDTSEAWDNFYDKVDEDVTQWFAGNPKLFREGIPNELEVPVGDISVTLTLDEEEPMDFDGAVEDQLRYTVIYNFNIEKVAFELFIPTFVSVEKVHRGNKIDLVNDILFDEKMLHLQRKQ